MKNTTILLALLGSAICWAQPPADCKPSSLNVPGAPYPCVTELSSGWPRRMLRRSESASARVLI